MRAEQEPETAEFSVS